MAKVFIPTQWRSLVPGDAADVIEVEASTIRQLLLQLENQYPALVGKLRDGDRLAPGLTIAIDDLLANRGLTDRLNGQSEIHFLPALGAG